jgi:hypothetical protein
VVLGAAIGLAPVLAAPVTADEELRIISVDDSQYPIVETVVVVPALLASHGLESTHFDARERTDARPLAVEPLDPATLELAVVVDASIGPERLTAAQGGLLEIPVHLPEPEISLVTAANPPSVALPLTSDPRAASVAFRSMAAGHGSALEAGIEMALDQFTPSAGWKAMIVVAGTAPRDADRLALAAERAQTSRVQTYVISVDSVPEELGRIAFASGGEAMAIGPDGFLAAVDDIVAELRGQYRLRIELSGDDPAAPVALAVSAFGITARTPLRIEATAGSRQLSGESGSPPSSPLPPVVLVVGGLLVVAVVVGLWAEAHRRSSHTPE